MAYGHILLTSDLSDEALRAFRPVADLARGFGARITLLHVVQVMTETAQGGMLATPILPPDMNEAKRTAEAELEKQAAALEGVEVSLEISSGQNVSEVVAQFASACGADLIALSTHGRSGFRRMVLGSVAEGVIRHATVPVLCFPPGK
jgi:nucleotide-binding universal stress UspA family protein